MWLSGLLAAALSLGTPLVLAAAGEVVLEKSGVINIGLEGMMLASAFGAFYMSYITQSAWLGLAGGTLCGLGLALLASYFIVRLGADQVVVGTGINLFSLGLTGALFMAQFGKGGELIAVSTLPKATDFALNPLSVCAALAVIASWLLLKKTRWGLAARAAGEAPDAAQAAGFSVRKLRFQAMLYSGVTAGLAGAYLTLAQTNSFAENMTEGRGFVVIAAVTFGRWSAAGSAMACLLISFAYGLKYVANAFSLGLPYQFFEAMPYLLALSVLAIAGRAAPGPAALGIPYKRGLL